MDSYLSTQRMHIFSDVSILIYVFDIESREVGRDLDTYSAVVSALKEHSPTAYVFGLIHKMDLIQSEHRNRLYQERSTVIRARSEGFDVETFGSSIWDQSLYKAWAGIVHKMIPNLGFIEKFLNSFAEKADAEEIVLFERSTFLMVTSQVTELGELNPNTDRIERMSSVLKTFKHSIARNTKSTPGSAGFKEFQLKTPQFNIFLIPFTDNTYLYCVVPPGEAKFNTLVLNAQLARDQIKKYLEDEARGDNGQFESSANAQD